MEEPDHERGELQQSKSIGGVAIKLPSSKGFFPLEVREGFVLPMNSLALMAFMAFLRLAICQKAAV